MAEFPPTIITTILKSLEKFTDVGKVIDKVGNTLCVRGTLEAHHHSRVLWSRKTSGMLDEMLQAILGQLGSRREDQKQETYAFLHPQLGPYI